jgi:multicomponent Na+:H+ antiporter subunit B
MIEILINIVLFSLLVVTALSVVRMRRLFGVVMMSGAFSLLSALLLVTLDAVDVAFTEAAVGAGMSTVLMLGTLALTSRTEKRPVHSPAIPLFVVIMTGAAILYGTLDMPNFGSATSPAQTGIAQEYLERTPHDIGVPNVVTAILASYRGYDTLGETGVVFAAGVGVLLLIGGLRSRKGKREDEESDREKAPGTAPGTDAPKRGKV